MKLLTTITICVLVCCTGCEQAAPVNFSSATQPGIAIVLLVDTSSSMADYVSAQGTKQQKSVIAQKALQQVIDYTSGWKQAHPDEQLQIAIYNFNSSVHEVLPMGEFGSPGRALFNEARVKAAVEQIPNPDGWTAIGLALTEGFRSLYASGCTRKHLVCITDGANTAGPTPENVARQLFSQTKGEVYIHFIAFDTSASKFSFLAETNGAVWAADNGDQLCEQLSLIFEKRILAEKEEP